jgi:EmrB/QacA subfamily drug resistance transporter
VAARNRCCLLPKNCTTSAGSTPAGVPRGVLPVLCVALAMVVAGLAGLNNALPALARDTGASQAELQWIVNAYALAFAALLLPAGAVGDRHGRRRVLLGGLAIFGGAALAAVFTDEARTLIALRAAMGVGAAMVMPVTLSIVTAEFPPEQRGKAVGTWVGVAGTSGILGLLASGLLLEWFSWSSVFTLNVVLAAVAIAGTLAVVPPSRSPEAPPLDRPGTALSAAGLAVMVYGIVEAPERGWTDPVTFAAVAAGLVLLGAFVAWELRTRWPMLDPRLFRLAGFGTGSVSIVVRFFAAFGLFFAVMQYLQFISGYSALEAALAMLPAGGVMMPIARNAPALAARLGFRVVGAAGLLLMAVGFALFSRLEVGDGYGHFLAGLLPFAVGMALAGSPATTAIMAAVGREAQGVASAVNNTTRELGGALGIAVLGSLLNAGYRGDVADAAAGLPPQVSVRAQESIAVAQQLGRGLGEPGRALATAAQEAFVHGFSVAMAVAAGVLVLGAVFVAARPTVRRAAPQRPGAEGGAAGSAPDTVHGRAPAVAQRAADRRPPRRVCRRRAALVLARRPAGAGAAPAADGRRGGRPLHRRRRLHRPVGGAPREGRGRRPRRRPAGGGDGRRGGERAQRGLRERVADARDRQRPRALPGRAAGARADGP